VGVIESVKDLSELIKKYNDAELYKKIQDLRDEIFNLREENQAYREKIKELENAIQIKGKLKKEGNLYYLYQEDGEKDGPFCLTCWDDDMKLIHLIEYSHPGILKTYKCNRCVKMRQKQ